MCRENERTHKHHIIPRYMGGNNSKENLVEVSITGHAMFHFCNYQLWGNAEDKIAWRMLSGQITVDEAKLEAMLLGSKRGSEKNKDKFSDPEILKTYKVKCKERFENSPNRHEMIDNARKNQPKAVEASKTPEARQKLRESLKATDLNKGENNSQYGTMWITDGTIEGSRRIRREEPIPDGFVSGVVFNTENYTFKSGEEHPNYNKMWITDGKNEYIIGKDGIIPDGYYKGRSQTFKDKYDKESARELGLNLHREKRGIHAQTHEDKVKHGRNGGKKSASQRWMCLETGYVSNAGPLTVYQRNRGIDTTKRKKL